MGKKYISFVLCIMLIVSFTAINAFADDIFQGKVISGTISLPQGKTAPQGGLNVFVSAYCDNATPNDRSDDHQGYTAVNIPEGQNQVIYSITVPDSTIGYQVYAYADGYGGISYSNQGNNLVDVSTGNAEQINLAFISFKSMRGVVCIPNGDTAPAGGLNVEIAAGFDNGTPDNRQDDIWYGTYTMIPEGQSQVAYTLMVPEQAAKGGCKVEFRASGYLTTYYTEQGGTKDFNTADIIDLGNGDRDNVNTVLIKGRTISGIISLPAGETAPTGGIGVSLNADSDNGTPNNWQDDLHTYAYVNIPEGQSQVGYSISVPDSNSAYTLDYHPSGYSSGRYSKDGSSLIDVRGGDQTNINITISRGKVISGIVSLPAGAAAPAGGLNVYVNAYCDNGTPENQADDLRGYVSVSIPEGQSQTLYSLMVPDSDIGYTVSANSDGYSPACYSNQGNYFVYVNRGNVDDINIAFTITKTISGTIRLPAGETAPVGGLRIDLDVYTENGTPDNWQDDLRIRYNAYIWEGQNEADYSIAVPQSNSGYTLHFGTQGYCWGAYHEGSNYLIDLSNGNKNNADLTFTHGKTISGIVRLPDGATAPVGGVNVRIESSSDNGTTDTWLDDMGNVANVTIPEGQNSAAYNMEVPESVTGFKMICNASGYLTTYYSLQGGTTNYGQAGLIDLSDGSKAGIDIKVETGNVLSISVINGKVTKNADKNIYIDGETVTLTALPDEGYQFAGWSGDASGNDATINVIMDSNKNITALFTQIIQKAVKTLEIPKDQKNLKLKPGDQKAIDLSVIYENGSVEQLDNAEWQSNNPAVATVDNGFITAVGFGKAKITASYMGKKITIEVDTRLKSLKFDGKDEIKSSPGKSYSLKLYATYADGTVKDVANDSLTDWISSNEATARVIGGVLNTGEIPGKAVVTAKYGDKTETIKIDSSVKKLSLK